MLRRLILLPLIIMVAPVFSQVRDSLTVEKLRSDSAKAKTDPTLVTAAPLLGGITLEGIVAPIKTPTDNFVLQQYSLEIGSPIYGRKGIKRPYFGKFTMRYQGMFLASEQNIGSDAFHRIYTSLAHTYVLKPGNVLTFIGSTSVASDFRKSVSFDDLTLLAGVRIGWRQRSDFRYGIGLMYVNTFAGQFLLPIPDFHWNINKKWTFNGILPVRMSLKYKLSPSQSVGATVALTNGLYRLNDTPGTDQFIQMMQVAGGVIYDLSINKRWRLNVLLSRTLQQRLQTFNNSQKLGLNDFEELQDRATNVSYQEKSFVFQAGVSYLF